MRKYSITKKACFSAALVLTGTMLIGIQALADGTGRRNHIQSRGKIDYGNGEVVLDSSDLTYLADEVDLLERTYKQFVLEYLNGINTYLDSDGNVTHNWEENDNEYFPSFSQLLNGINLSQEVNTGTTVDNLSKDMGAWVNGEYINGNGNDVNEAYLKGLKEGFDNAMDYCTINYVYHKHTGDSSNGGGCYVYTSWTPKSNCGRDHGGRLHYVELDNGDRGFRCSYCGHLFRVGEGSEGAPCVNTILGETTYGWTLGCGKTESTIESATIVFNE